MRIVFCLVLRTLAVAAILEGLAIAPLSALAQEWDARASAGVAPRVGETPQAVASSVHAQPFAAEYSAQSGFDGARAQNDPAESRFALSLIHI